MRMESLLEEIIKQTNKIYIGFTAEKTPMELSKFSTSLLSHVQKLTDWISGLTTAVSWCETQKYAENKSASNLSKQQLNSFKLNYWKNTTAIILTYGISTFSYG